MQSVVFDLTIKGIVAYYRLHPWEDVVVYEMGEIPESGDVITSNDNDNVGMYC